MSTTEKFFSNDNAFLSPHEVVRPAPYDQIAVIMTDSTPLYWKTNCASGNMLIIYQSSWSPLEDVHAKEIFFQRQPLFIAAWSGSSGSRRPNCRNNHLFDAVILEKEFRKRKYLDSLPIQPKLCTIYARKEFLFQRLLLFIAAWSGSCGMLRPNCRAITSDSRLSYWDTKWASRNILIVYQSSRSYVQYIHAKNFYSSDYCFFSPPEVVRPACDGQIAAQLRAIRGSHTGKRSEQAEIFWKFTNPAEDLYRISTPMNFFPTTTPFYRRMKWFIRLPTTKLPL